MIHSHEGKGAGKPLVCVFDTSPQLLSYLERSLRQDFRVCTSIDPAEFLLCMGTLPRVDLIAYAWDSVEQSLHTLQEARRQHPRTPILLLCSSAQPEDFPSVASLSNALLLKPFTAKEIRSGLLNLLASQETAATVQKSTLDESHSFVRASTAMHEVERQASLVAPSDIPVLILGESGTGKEILALYLHKQSRRHNRTFMKINCAAMPAELLESELFGYEQGAFTGAARTKPGKFETCDGGTIFLDEIGEMPATLQAKLLQVLQDGTFSRLGSRTSVKTNVRVISATNVAIREAIQNGRFREDVYYRLNGLTIKLPPLRDRIQELPTLLEHFLQKGADRFKLEPLAVSSRLQKAMKEYHWPGNLRELENLVNRLLVLRDEQALFNELAASIASRPQENASPQDSAEAAEILQALEDHRWNRRSTANALGMSYKTLLSRIKQYDLLQRLD